LAELPGSVVTERSVDRMWVAVYCGGIFLDGPKPSPALVSLLKVLLAAKCEQHHVAPKLVANSEDIDRIAVEDAPDVQALQGWRHEVFGADALALPFATTSLDGAIVAFGIRNVADLDAGRVDFAKNGQLVAIDDWLPRTVAVVPPAVAMDGRTARRS
jgi:hypothetical protein